MYGAVLPPFRKNIFLTTKSPERSRKGAEADLEKSLRALKTDYLDLWQIHQVSEMSEVEQIFAPGGAIEAFEAAKKAGQVPLHRASPGITTPRSTWRCSSTTTSTTPS